MRGARLRRRERGRENSQIRVRAGRSASERALSSFPLSLPLSTASKPASSGLPANATIPNGSGNNITYEVVPTSSNGTSFVNATVESVPLGVNATGWNVTYTNSSEPYEGAHLILGEHQLLSLYPRR